MVVKPPTLVKLPLNPQQKCGVEAPPTRHGETHHHVRDLDTALGLQSPDLQRAAIATADRLRRPQVKSGDHDLRILF